MTLRYIGPDAFATVKVPISPPRDTVPDPVDMDSLELLFSLCYTAWGSSNAHIELSQPPRTKAESSILYQPAEGQENFNFESILSQYGIGNISRLIGVMAINEPITDATYPFHQPSIATMLSRMGTSNRLNFVKLGSLCILSLHD
jgi:hypothetical protein